MSSLTFTVVNRKQSTSWRRRPQKKSQKKTFCKVCFDASKPESLYTNHFLKDRPGPRGKVVCPTLLSTECRYCHENGHFKSHCPQLADRKRVQNDKAKARVQQSKQAFSAGSWMTAGNTKALEEAMVAAKMQRKVTVPVPKFDSNSKFAALDDSDDEEEIMLTAVPAFAKAKAPQGAWALKPTVKVINGADLEKNLLRKADIVAELAELNVELQHETQNKSGSWADDGDIEDLEIKIEILEEELADMQTVSLC